MQPMRRGPRVARALLFSLALLCFVIPWVIPGRFFNIGFNKFPGGVLGGNLQNDLACEAPLRVFMYDLPRRLNFGILERDGPDQDLPWPDGKRAPPWPAKAGLRKQHNVEYWMTLDLLGQREYAEGFRSRAIRVKDPEDADVFFVPFFSSLSFSTFGKTMRGPNTEYDRALQAELVALLHDSKWWQRSAGRDHVIPMHHPNSFRFLRKELNTSILIVADFGRSSGSISRLGKDVVAPYTHVVEALVYERDPYESRTVLLYFQGRIERKDKGMVRVQLEKVLNHHPKVHFVDSTSTPLGMYQATQGMRSSLFCLHPAGDTPSSCRLFDAIASHCVPVIISNEIELPFENELDYTEFCLFFSVEEALRPGYLLSYLESFDRERWLTMWSRIKEVAHHFSYEESSRPGDAVNMIWNQVASKLPPIKLSRIRAKRLKIEDWISW